MSDGMARSVEEIKATVTEEVNRSEAAEGQGRIVVEGDFAEGAACIIAFEDGSVWIGGIGGREGVFEARTYYQGCRGGEG